LAQPNESLLKTANVGPDEPSVLQRKFYFINEIVEDLLREYLWTSCTSVDFRDSIMSHAPELIKQIIRKQNLHMIYPGHEESAFGDLVQTAWCVPPRSLVFSDGGICEIGSLVGDDTEGPCNIKLFGADGVDTTDRYAYRPASPIRRITTKYNYQIDSTLDHPLLVLRESSQEWVKASDIEPGDLLAVQYNQHLFGSDNIIDFAPSKCGGTTKMWSPPHEFTESLAYLIGLVISEGSVEDGRVIIYNTDDEIINRLEDGICGLSFSYEGDGRNVYNDVRFLEFLGWLGFEPGIRAYQKKIPLRLLRCSKNIVSSMLRGMFDGDGHSDRHTGKVGYTSTSVSLINQLRVVLLNFGIISKFSTSYRQERTMPTGRTYKLRRSYQLLLSSLDSGEFYRQIGFDISRKQFNNTRLTNMPFRLVDTLSTSAIQQRLGDFTKSEIWAVGFDRHLLMCKKQFTVATFCRLAYGLGLDKTNEFIKQRLDDYDGDAHRVLWLPVKDIEDMGEEVTVGVCLPRTKSFTVNGIISHNTQIERTLYKFRARPHCRVCYNPDRPGDSVLYQPADEEYGIITYKALFKHLGGRICPRCSAKLGNKPRVEPRQGTFGGSETILFRGSSKVFNMWSQIARTVILAFVKKEGRDKKNATSYRDHLTNSTKVDKDRMQRFFSEAEELFKHNDDHVCCLNALAEVIATDDKPYDGLIGKLVETSELSRSQVTSFIRILRLRSQDFTDSPLNRELDRERQQRKLQQQQFQNEEE